MNAKEQNLKIIKWILNPHLILDHIQLCADVKSDNKFPFSRKEFAAIQWQLCFPHLVVAYKLNNAESSDLFADFIEIAVPKLKARIVVGDYIRAPMELRLIKPHFGFSGMFGNISNKEISVDCLTTVVIRHKIKGLLTIYDMTAAESSPWLDPFGIVKNCHGIQDISKSLAMAVVISYWGRVPASSEQNFVDELADVIYESWYKLDQIINGGEQDIVE